MATALSPGNSVPASVVIDQLDGRLTSVQMDELLAAMAATRKSEVQPGDLITAALMNQVLQDIDDLRQRMSTLSGSPVGTRNSAAAATLHDAWAFYGSLVKNGDFLPTTTSSDALLATAEINAYLQDAMYVALAGGSLAYAATDIALVDAFERLYGKQHDIVVLFSAPIRGIADTSEHRQFAALLNVMLEQNTALGELSLRKALDAKLLPSAIAAQNRINRIVRDQAGDVTTGNLDVQYRGAVGNTETLVLPAPGSPALPPVLYRFSVANKTNRNVTVQLGAAFLPPRQDWTQLSIVGVDGAARSTLTLSPFDPAKPSDPAATQEVRVAVSTPAGASAGDSGELEFTAGVPEPINRGGRARRKLTVAAAPATQTPGAVNLASNAPVLNGDPARSTERIPLTAQFEFNFSALQGPASRNFRFHLDISQPAAPDALFLVQFTPADAALDSSASTAARKSSVAFTMSDGASRTVTAIITPLPGSRGNSLTFTARVESATDGIIATSRPITIIVVN